METCCIQEVNSINWKEYMDSSWHLDKDILIKGNKVYSPDTCCLVPQEINILFVKCNINRGDLPIGVIEINGRFSSSVSKNNKIRHLGKFNTLEEAFESYKFAKEKHIKEVADKWRDKLDPRVYEAMYNYEVEITD